MDETARKMIQTKAITLKCYQVVDLTNDKVTHVVSNSAEMAEYGAHRYGDPPLPKMKSGEGPWIVKAFPCEKSDCKNEYSQRFMKRTSWTTPWVEVDEPCTYDEEG